MLDISGLLVTVGRNKGELKNAFRIDIVYEAEDVEDDIVG